jgi:DNA repair protein RadC
MAKTEIELNFRIDDLPEGYQNKSPQLNNSELVYYRARCYAGADREVLLVLFLNSKNHEIKLETHSIGAVDSSAVYPREIFRSALLCNASSFIMIHNHPSGDPEPSLCDKLITKDCVYAGKKMGILVLDHLILGANNTYFSFADHGLIEEYGLSTKDER